MPAIPKKLPITRCSVKKNEYNLITPGPDWQFVILAFTRFTGVPGYILGDGAPEGRYTLFDPEDSRMVP